MSDDEIIETYDTNFNMTLAELSNLSGRTIKELKTLLMKGN